MSVHLLGRSPPESGLILMVSVVLLGVVIAGFWNFHFVDGLSETAIAYQLSGDTGEGVRVLRGTQGVTFGSPHYHRILTGGDVHHPSLFGRLLRLPALVAVYRYPLQVRSDRLRCRRILH